MGVFVQDNAGYLIAGGAVVLFICAVVALTTIPKRARVYTILYKPSSRHKHQSAVGDSLVIATSIRAARAKFRRKHGRAEIISITPGRLIAPK